jgi:hypothetical protein
MEGYYENRKKPAPLGDLAGEKMARIAGELMDLVHRKPG